MHPVASVKHGRQPTAGGWINRAASGTLSSAGRGSDAAGTRAGLSVPLHTWKAIGSALLATALRPLSFAGINLHIQ
jgi:hypothetical protein